MNQSEIQCREVRSKMAQVAAELLGRKGLQAPSAGDRGADTSAYPRPARTTTAGTRRPGGHRPDRSGGALGEQLREAILRSKLTRHQIAKRAGLGYGTVYDFVGGRDIQLSSAARIAAVVGVEFARTCEES